MAQERIDIYTKKGSDAEHEKLQENIDALESKTDSKAEELEEEIALKANDAEVVHLAGTETITGEKTFSATINGASIDLSGTATIGGQLELSGSPNLTAGGGVFNFPAQGTASSPATVATTADISDLESSTDTKLESYYTKTEADNLLDEKADASSVYTKTETDNLLAEKADETDLTALDTRVSTAETNITSLTSRMTTAESNITSQGTRLTTAEGEIDTLQSEIATKAESADVSALTTRVSSVETTLGTKADADDVYTKSETDTLLNAKQDTLTFDTTPTSGSTNPVTSDGLYKALADKVDVSYLTGNYPDLSDMAMSIESAVESAKEEALESIAETYLTISSASSTYATKADVYTKTEIDEKLDDLDLSGYYTSTQVDTLLADKQDTLTFDSTPTSGSENPITSGGVYTALASKADTSALSDYLTTATAETTYATKTEVEAKQDTLVSGTNIKTINGESILGSGNIQIEEGGATTTVDTSITADSQNPVTSQAIYEALEGKADSSDVSTLSSRVDTIETELDTKADSSDLTALTTRVSTAETNITTLTSSLSSVESELADKAEASDLTALTTRVSTAESDIDSLETSVSSVETTLSNKLDTSTASSTYATKTELTTSQSTLQSAIDEKQDTLVSGTNIKTIGGISVLGSGDIPNPEVEVDTEVTEGSENPVTGGAVYDRIVPNVYRSSLIYSDFGENGQYEGTLTLVSGNCPFAEAQNILVRLTSIGSNISYNFVRTEGNSSNVAYFRAIIPCDYDGGLNSELNVSTVASGTHGFADICVAIPLTNTNESSLSCTFYVKYVIPSAEFETNIYTSSIQYNGFGSTGSYSITLTRSSGTCPLNLAQSIIVGFYSTNTYYYVFNRSAATSGNLHFTGTILCTSAGSFSSTISVATSYVKGIALATLSISRSYTTESSIDCTFYVRYIIPSDLTSLSTLSASDPATLEYREEDAEAEEVEETSTPSTPTTSVGILTSELDTLKSEIAELKAQVEALTNKSSE